MRTTPDKTATPEVTDRPGLMPWWRRPCWRYASVSFLVGVVYTGLAMLAGAELRLGESDVTLLGGAVVEVSFAIFGYLLGLAVEARQQDRTRLEELAMLRSRLAQHEKLASLGQMAGVIAHEVRNPLAILRAHIQNLEEDLGDDAERRATCTLLLEEIDRLAHVTGSILGLARPLEPERRAVTAEQVVERVAELAAPTLEHRTLRLQLAPDGPPPIRLEADPDLLCQVLLGLLDNAARVSSPGQVITLSWGVGEGGVELRVRDRGPGIPPAERERVFEPFVTTRKGGNGLGLAVARQIVEAHGGRLEADEALGGGAELRMVLPRQQGEVARGSAAERETVH